MTDTEIQIYDEYCNYITGNHDARGGTFSDLWFSGGDQWFTVVLRGYHGGATGDFTLYIEEQAGRRPGLARGPARAGEAPSDVTPSAEGGACLFRRRTARTPVAAGRRARYDVPVSPSERHMTGRGGAWRSSGAGSRGSRPPACREGGEPGTQTAEPERRQRAASWRSPCVRA